MMKPKIETPHGKLIRSLLVQIEKAKASLAQGKATHATIELEYAEVVVNDTFAQYPELKGAFYL